MDRQKKVNLIEKLKKNAKLKFSFGKDNLYHKNFSEIIGAKSMHNEGLGLGISKYLSPANQLWSVFQHVNNLKGVFIFNISGVDIMKAKKGFNDYEEAAGNGMITEWELSIILQNEDYLNRTLFHNGRVEFININQGIQYKWN